MPLEPVHAVRQQGHFNARCLRGLPTPEQALRSTQAQQHAAGLQMSPLSVLLLLSSMRSVGNSGLPDAASQGSNRGETPAPSGAALAFPFAMQQIAQQQADVATASDAWPLPGACAGKSRKIVKRPPPPPAPATKKNTATAPRHRPQVTGRRPQATDGEHQLRAQRGKARARAGSSHDVKEKMRGAARNHAAMSSHAAAASSAKESMQVPLSHSSSAVFKPKTAEEKRQAAANAISTPPPLSKPVIPQLLDPAGNTGSGTKPEQTPLDPPGTLPADAQCLRFHNLHQANHQLARLRHSPSPLRYCVPPQAEARFANMWAVPPDSWKGVGGWLVALPLREEIPTALRGQPIHRSATLGAPRVATEAQPLGGDNVHAIITISPLPAGGAAAQQSSAAAPVLLVRNSFRLLEHVGLSGHRQLCLAYFLGQEREGSTGVKAGLLPIELSATGEARLYDPDHELTLVAHDLEGLLRGVEAMSGLHYEPPQQVPPAVPDAQDDPLAFVPEHASHLFVADEETLSWHPPHDYLRFNNDLPLFPPPLTVPGSDPRSAALYWNSFRIAGSELLYVDDEGRSGTLRLGCPIAIKSAPVLECPRPMDEAFASRNGLHRGIAYNLEEIARLLERRGMLRMPEMQDDRPDPGTPDIPTASRLVGRPDPSTGSDSPVATDGTTAGVPSTFHFEHGVLQYTDHDGRHGRLHYDEEMQHGQQRYRLRSPTDPHDRYFMARNGLQQSPLYSEEELIWTLVGEGFVQA